VLHAASPAHVPALDPEPAAPQSEVELSQSLARPARFAALLSPTCRAYLGGGVLAMMADNIEHVITYWVIWRRFHSPALTGFEVISHWLPFLLLSPYFGALADRCDCRRLIQGWLFWSAVISARAALGPARSCRSGAFGDLDE
jgi:hypothetical protein